MGGNSGEPVMISAMLRVAISGSPMPSGVLKATVSGMPVAATGASGSGATGSGVACWTVASDSRRDITLISTVLKKDLAQLNAGQDIETREKALLVAETQLAARRRAEQRRIIDEARTALGPDSGTAAVDWRATAFDDNETLVSSDAEFLRGVNCELVKIALREITRKAACSSADSEGSGRDLEPGKAVLHRTESRRTALVAPEQDRIRRIEAGHVRRHRLRDRWHCRRWSWRRRRDAVRAAIGARAAGQCQRSGRGPQDPFDLSHQFSPSFTSVTWWTSIPPPRKPPSQYIR